MVLAASPIRTRRLRDLSDEEFRERYDSDRFTATVLSNRFTYVIDNIVGQLLRTAFSPIVRGADFAATLSGPPELGYPVAAVSQTIPVFIGSIPDAVRIVLEEYGVERLQPGDLLTANDYYRVGTHLNDVCFIRPMFSGDRLIGAVTLRCHQMDMGGRQTGGFLATKLNTYEDGLRLPPMLLFRDGQPVRETVKLFFANTRFGALLFADMKAIHSCLDMAERLLISSIAKYGVDAYVGTFRYVDDASAETMSAALESVPDGIYEGTEILDGDGLPESPEYRVHVRINKRGGRAEFDFSGTSPASRTAVNCAWPDTKTAVATALKCLIDRRSRYASGALRNVDIVVPPDSLINPSPPHACQYYWEPLITIMLATYRALNPVLGEDGVSADGGPTTAFITGSRPDGSSWVGTFGGGPATPWGATKHGDGDSSQATLLFNNVRMGVEEIENTTPGHCLRLQSDFIPDTGGPGKHRGGVSSAADVLWLVDSTHVGFHGHLKSPPGGGGVAGGLPGSVGGAWAWTPSAGVSSSVHELPKPLTDPRHGDAIPLFGVMTPDSHVLHPDGTFFAMDRPEHLPAGSIVRIVSNAAGGWGNPFERDPALVLRDVRDEYVTIAGAARDYGVVIHGDPVMDPEGLVLDDGATESLRKRGRNG